jgi:RNA polymerase sigma-70 factor (ECF subfamily)
VIDADTRGAHRELEARLRPFVARRVSDSSAVDDVLQDVLLRMHRSLPNLREDDRFGPWLYRVARSAIADHHRAHLRQPLPVESLEEPTAEPEEAEADVARELAGYIAAFVAMLATPYREALTLTELEGLSQKEAASMCGISLSGMKSRVQRGREQLRALIERCCEIGLDARGRVISCVPKPGGPRPGCDCC